MGKVAIYMCCYNHEKYVAEAIETILGQTFEDWELWIANDGSTDSSKAVIESYTDKRIHFYNFEKNTRLVGAQTFLLDKIKDADCEYIVGTASDDKWKLDRLKKQVDVLDAHPEYAACFSWDEMLFEEGTENDPYRTMANYSHQENRSRFEWLRTFGLYENDMNGCSAMVRKDAYFEAGGYNQHFIRLGDYRLWLRIAMKHQIYVVQEPLVYYRRHATNISRVDKYTALGVINEMFIIKKFFLEHLSDKDFFRSFYTNMIYTNKKDKADLLADKLFFALCVNNYKDVFRQIAAGIWLENSDDRSFVDLIKEKYVFENALLEKINHNSGLGPMLLESLGQKDTYSLDSVNPVNVFLDKYAADGIGENNINSFSWNAVYMLAAHIEQNNLNSRVLDRIKEELYTTRMNMIEEKTSKIMHIIYCEEYTEMVLEIASELTTQYDIYVSKVNKEQDYFASVQVDSSSFPDGVKYLDLYDRENSCLFFDEDLGIDTDIIWYIGTLGDGFECRKMMRGYKLGVSQMAIIDKTSIQDEKDMAIFGKILDSVDFV